jgi:hypothetical protein
VHAPDAQPLVAALGSAHTVPHAPHWVGSFAVFAQKAVGAVPQVASGAAQLAPHTPPLHTCPAPHAVPHAPQLALSVAVFTSQPSLATRSQSAKPAAQLVTPHAPAAQAVTAWGSTHARPHPPQCDALVVVSVSQPLAAAPSQSP